MHGGAEEADRLVLWLTATVDGPAPHCVLVVGDSPVGMTATSHNAFTVQVAVFVDVARSSSDTVGGSRGR